MIQKSKELKQKTVTVESDSDEAEASDTEQQLHRNQDELIDVALATTALATTRNNPWMLPPVVKKSALYSKPQVKTICKTKVAKSTKQKTKHLSSCRREKFNGILPPFVEIRKS